MNKPLGVINVMTLFGKVHEYGTPRINSNLAHLTYDTHTKQTFTQINTRQHKLKTRPTIAEAKKYNFLLIKKCHFGK